MCGRLRMDVCMYNNWHKRKNKNKGKKRQKNDRGPLAFLFIYESVLPRGLRPTFFVS